ncbi:hypothetical protein AAC387_Pa01g1050 [Persea americana]
MWQMVSSSFGGAGLLLGDRTDGVSEIWVGFGSTAEEDSGMWVGFGSTVEQDSGIWVGFGSTVEEDSGIWVGFRSTVEEDSGIWVGFGYRVEVGPGGEGFVGEEEEKPWRRRREEGFWVVGEERLDFHGNGAVWMRLWDLEVEEKMIDAMNAINVA